MFKLGLDTSVLDRKFTAIEKRNLPFAVVLGINQTAFDTRQAWGVLVRTRFDRPTPLTVGAVLYIKATKADYTATIFLRDQTQGGTPPSKYLRPEEFGGSRPQKAFERHLARNPRARKYAVPGMGADLDAFGNIPVKVLSRIASQLGVAEHTSGFSANESIKGRLRRLKRQRRRGGGGSYFILAKRHGKLRPGVVYERSASADIGANGPRLTSHVRSILVTTDKPPRYRPRFGARAEAQRIARARWPSNFKAALARAVSTSR